MNVALKPDAVDCARLINIVATQIYDCLEGRREFVFVTTKPQLPPADIDRHELALSIFKAMGSYDLADLLVSLRVYIMRTRLCVERQDIVQRFAEYTVQRMTQTEKEALCELA